MARLASQFTCQTCGAAHPRWNGRCDACGAWNSIVEEITNEATPKGLGKGKGKALVFAELAGPAQTLAATTPVLANSTGYSAAGWCAARRC